MEVPAEVPVQPSQQTLPPSDPATEIPNSELPETVPVAGQQIPSNIDMRICIHNAIRLAIYSVAI